MKSLRSRRLVSVAFVVASTVMFASLFASGASAQLPAAARDAEPVVVTGADVPSWSRTAAVVVCDPYPAGTMGDDRDAHHGTAVVPPDDAVPARTGADVTQIAAYRRSATGWIEIPVQVDQMYFYCLGNAHSSFGIYSGVDKELTYAWDVEAWKKTDGVCSATYPPGTGPMPDPVGRLDNDDEVVFMARDAGPRAPTGALPPGATEGYEISVIDPLDPGNLRYVYLVLRPGGSAFTTANGYVSYVRDPDADEWIDKCTFRDDDPEKLGTSNTGYGPNLSGTVCRTAIDPGRCPAVADHTPRPSTDRFPRDGVTVTSPTYRWRASGRWMVRGLSITAPGQNGAYGPDLIDRWKGRAFQQAPDSTISLVGFEDEQVNWEANSALLGERIGPVRAIREIWGADSGTNVTKTESFYRDTVTYHYHVRVHPIPPDGLYTSWDYNRGAVTKYYDTLKPGGVDIDGQNDDQGNIDGVGNFPAYFDAPDPTFSPPTANLNWEEVSGNFGSLVYIVEIKGATTAENPAVVPYYRDDSCLDDGTGDNPLPRPWPGEAGDDPRVLQGYCLANAKPAGCHVCRLRSDPGPCDVDCKLGQTQGAYAAHGIHYFFSNDTDNAASPEVLTEIDAQQWQFMVPTSTPTNVGQRYGNVVIVPLETVAAPITGLPTTTTIAPTTTTTAASTTSTTAGPTTSTTPGATTTTTTTAASTTSTTAGPTTSTFPGATTTTTTTAASTTSTTAGPTTSTTPGATTTTTTLAGPGNLHLTNVKVSAGAGNGKINLRGDFQTPPAFTFPPPFTVLVHDSLTLDRAHTFMNCRSSSAGRMRCLDTGGDGGVKASFKPYARNPSVIRFRVSFQRQAISGPLAAPVTMTLTHNSGVTRIDSISSCRNSDSKLSCREP